MPQEFADKIDAITRYLHEKEKNIFPNPSTYTAACAIILKVPTDVAPYLLILGRLGGWSALALKANGRKV